jgi:archaellum component FlaC
MSEDFNSVQETAQGEESIVDGARRELEEIDSSDLSEHAARFEALHKKLQDSLNSIDGL